DLAPPLPLNITGKFASKLSLDLTIDRGAGPQASRLDLLSMWGALQPEGGSTSLTTIWQMCTLGVPGLGVIPLHLLDGMLQETMNATLSSAFDGARFTQPEVAMVFGAFLAD